MNQAIGMLNEKPLHAAIKSYLADPGDEFEVNIDGYIIDLLKEDSLVEIQTSNFSSIRSKLDHLTRRYRVELVYPIAYEKWIVKLPKEPGGNMIRRKSPKRGRIIELFKELVYIPHLVKLENFNIQVLMIQEEEIRRFVGNKRWRNHGWIVEERRLIGVIDEILIKSSNDIMGLIPSDLPRVFTTLDLAEVMGTSHWLAQKTAYCLRKLGMIASMGKRDKRVLYEKYVGN
jgi:hypothetical protein